MKITELVYKLSELVCEFGDLDVTLPQCDDSGQITWNAKISDVYLDENDSGENFISIC